MKINVETLLRRIFAARATSRLSSLLAAVKRDQNLARNAFKASGSKEELEHAVTTAVEQNKIPVRDLAKLVDEIEEHGAQHTYVFDLTDEGRKALTSAAFLKEFDVEPSQPTEHAYADLPSRVQLHFAQRAGLLTVKQIFTAEFWQKNSKESKETDTRRTVVYDRECRRAVNFLQIDPVSGEMELRIDRVRDQMDDRLADRMLKDFEKALAPVLKLAEHATPLLIWRGFSHIVGAIDETYMTTDRASDPSVAVLVSSRRQSGKGTDIRQHEAFKGRSSNYVRDTLNIYWKVPKSPGDDEEKDRYLHSILARKREEGRELAKVYIAARVSAEEHRHVLSRIRYFASRAS